MMPQMSQDLEDPLCAIHVQCADSSNPAEKVNQAVMVEQTWDRASSFSKSLIQDQTLCLQTFF